MQIKKSLEKIPGGMMVVPLLLGAIINTFFPKALEVGGFTTALFKQGSLTLIGCFLFCMGAQMNFRVAPKALKKGLILTVIKYGVGATIGLGVGKVFGAAGILGLTPLAIIAAMTNSNGGLFVALTGEYGDKSDVGAVSILSLNDGPFLTMVALGASGLASIPVEAFIGVLVPVALGMLLGNLDEEMRTFFGQGERLLIPFFAFALGANMNFGNIFAAGLSGVLLGLMTVFITGFAGYFALKLFGEKNGIAGIAEGSTAGNAVATPAAIAAVDPTIASIVGTATAQIAAACIITALLCPVMVVLMDKHQKKKGIIPNKINEIV
jgi:2-keto-3-deoxygluconate permease